MVRGAKILFKAPVSLMLRAFSLPANFVITRPIKVSEYTEKKSYLADGEGCLSVDKDVPGYRRV